MKQNGEQERFDRQAGKAGLVAYPLTRTISQGKDCHNFRMWKESWIDQPVEK